MVNTQHLGESPAQPPRGLDSIARLQIALVDIRGQAIAAVAAFKQKSPSSAHARNKSRALQQHIVEYSAGLLAWNVLNRNTSIEHSANALAHARTMVKLAKEITLLPEESKPLNIDLEQIVRKARELLASVS